MKFLTKLNVLILLLSLGFSSSLLASNTIPPESKSAEHEIKKDAALYYLKITVEDEVRPSGRFLGMQYFYKMPNEQKESLMNMIMAKCANKFDVNIEPVYTVNKKGKVIKGLSEEDTFYFPSTSHKNAVTHNDQDLFIFIDIRVANEGKALKVGRRKSVIKPNASGRIIVYDRNKEKIYKKKIYLKSLEGIITLTDVKEGICDDHTVIISERVINDLLKD